MRMKKHGFKVSITAMNGDELFNVLTNEDVKKADFDLAVNLYLKLYPNEGVKKLLDIAEELKEGKVYGRLMFFLVKEGHVDVDLYPSPQEPD